MEACIGIYANVLAINGIIHVDIETRSVGSGFQEELPHQEVGMRTYGQELVSK